LLFLGISWRPRKRCGARDEKVDPMVDLEHVLLAIYR
jgi:hypothetical protein